jgi:hypothetical protein
MTSRAALTRAVGHRTVMFVLVALALWGGWEAFVRLTAPRRIDGALQRALAHEPLVNVAITLGFAPEEFHIRLLQDYGVVSGVRGTTVLVNRVSAHDVRRIARWYWVQRITTQ